MIAYRDITFCANYIDCPKALQCKRALGADEVKYISPDLPVSYADFYQPGEKCDYFLKRNQ